MVANLIYPVVMSWLIESHPFIAMYMMLAAATSALKITSFHHVYHDNRKMIRSLLKEMQDGTIENPEENIMNLPKKVYEEASKYPRNLKIRHFIRFLLAPTCCY